MPYVLKQVDMMSSVATYNQSSKWLYDTGTCKHM